MTVDTFFHLKALLELEVPKMSGRVKEEILMKILDVYVHTAILWQILNQTLSEFFTTGVSRQGNILEEKRARSGNKEYIWDGAQTRRSVRGLPAHLHNPEFQSLHRLWWKALWVMGDGVKVWMWLVPFIEAAERTVAIIPIKCQTSRIQPL